MGPSCANFRGRQARSDEIQRSVFQVDEPLFNVKYQDKSDDQKLANQKVSFSTQGLSHVLGPSFKSLKFFCQIALLNG